MSRDFVYSGSPAHIVFGQGKSALAGEWVDKLGCRRALVLSTPQQKADAEALAARSGRFAAGVFSGAVMHTPIDVTEKAMEVVRHTSSDCVVSLGGGSTTGLGKERFSYRPAADRHPDHLCRLRSDPDPRPDRRRARRRRCAMPASCRKSSSTIRR